STRAAAEQAPGRVREDGAERPSGRRALAVDPGAVERRRTQDAEELARIPQRLREDRRSGRRVAASSDSESWLWFVVDEATPGREALEQLSRIAEDSPNTAVIGPKRVRHRETADAAVPLSPSVETADALVDVGITLTHGGRI